MNVFGALEEILLFFQELFHNLYFLFILELCPVPLVYIVCTS
jgi:hypothetical protein